MFAEAVTKTKLKNAAKLLEEKTCKCILCPRRLRKVTMVENYRKKHKENFTGIKCKLYCHEHREEMFKDYIKQHNIYSKNKYYMKPEKLEDLLNAEHYDVILVRLSKLAVKRRETNHEMFKSMNSRGCGYMYNM